MLHRKENNEKDLLRRISCGDEQAFALLYERYHHIIAYRAYAILKSKSQTEDVIQEVFFKLWSQRASISTILNMESYLSTLARNSCLNLLKANVRKQVLETNYVNEVARDNEDFFTDVLSEKACYSLLDEAIEKLPQQQQKVYLLSKIERKKYLDIASEMKISRESVKKYLQLANQSIKSYLTKHKDSIVGIILLFSLN